MKLKKIVSLLLSMVMMLSMLPITIGAAELPINGNKLDIADQQVGPFTLQYLEVYLQESYLPVSIVSAEQNGTTIDIALSPDTDPSAMLQAGFGGTGMATLSHSNNKCTLSDGNGTMTCSVTAFQGRPVAGASFTINFSLATPAGPAVKFTSNLSEAEAVYVQGKPATPITVSAEYVGGETEENVTYQWYKNSEKSNVGGIAIDGATSNRYTPATDEIGIAYYYVTASCEGLSATSKIATVTVEAPEVKFTSNLNETEIKCTQGKDVPALTVAAEYTGVTDNAVTYQWYSNTTKSTEGGTLIENATDASYTPASDNVGTTYYYVVATCEEKNSASKIATVTIEEPIVKITSDLDEEEKFCIFGKSAPNLAISAEYTGVTEEVITYQWYSNTTKSTEDGTPIDNAIEASYTPKTDALGTTYYYAVASCEGKSAVSAIATVTVEADLSPESGLWLGIETSNGSVNFVKFTDANGEKIDGLYSELDGTKITVTLPRSYGANEKVTADFNLTQTATNDGKLPFISGSNAFNQGVGSTTAYTVALASGRATKTLYLYNSKPRATNNNPAVYIISYAIANEIPALADGQNTEGTAEIVAGNAYTLDLAPVFTDADGDALTYSVKINGEAAVAADVNYSFAPTLGGTYTLEFFANDFMSASEQSYTVTLDVINSTVTYDMSVLLPSDIAPAFYITNGYDSGTDVLGDTLVFVSGETADGYIPYTVSVPENISEISVRDAAYGGMAIPAASESTVTLQKVETEIIDFSDKEISGTVSVSYGEKKAVGVDGKFLLVPQKEYKFTASPENTSIYSAKTETLTLTEEITAVTVKVPYKNPKTIITTTGATAKMFKYAGNYHVHTVYEPLATVENGNGTSTHYFSVSGDISYRVSMEGKITKAGYLKTGNSVTVLHSEADKLPTDRVDYTTVGTNAAEVGDDSVLLGINQQNHLSLLLGATKTLKAYRTWQIIDLSYNNHIIEPDFSFNIISGEDVVSLAPYENQPTTNGSGNWRKLTAIGEGTAVVEVTYDAIDISGGSYNGFYGAADPARTGLFIVTVGENVPDVDFGIDCKTGADSMVYTPSNAKPWDAEFDTLYFLGESGEIKLSPTFADGNITEVAVSGDKGESYTVLEETDGVYTAPIISGNNIIRVTTDKGIAYQIVRGDKVELAIKNITNPGKPISAGDEISLTLIGVHTPIPKIAGTYNPGYKNNMDGDGGVHLHYSFGDDTIKSEGKQYNFSLYGTTVKFTVPADSEETEFTLTDGYIGVGVIGVTTFPNDGESHRNIPDAGGTTRGSTTTFHTRSLLPDITVKVGMLPSGNTAPFIRENAPKTATLNLGGTYALSMSKVFTDRESDTLTYTAKVGNGEASLVADAYYTFTPDSVGTCTIEFTANDGTVDSDIHTVTLYVKEKQSTSTSSIEFDIDEDDIAGYVKVSFADKGKRVEGEENITYPKALGTIISTKRVPFADGDTVADVTLRLLDAYGFTYEYTGTTKDGFYLASIGGFTLKGISYDSFGEFDAGTGSGWMITLNNDFIEYGASEFEVANGDVIKWQYTCQLGSDIGDPFYSDSSSSESSTNTYTVKFETNGGSAVSNQKVDKNDTATEPEAPTKDGYTFGGWYTDKELTKEYDFDTKVTKSFTLYAKWTEKASADENHFSDIGENDWYYLYVQYVYENGLMQGTDDGFEPDGNMTRAMLVTVLYRLDGAENGKDGCRFTDVAEGEWYADAVAWANENGIVVGISETEFAPNDNITREQMAAVIYRYAKFKGYDVSDKADISDFADADEISGYALDALAWANANELVKGTTDTTVSPKGTATRAHVAAILMRFCENIAK
ncbi:MAG: S-layer homology domain-containing protein [Clostridia bacterium]|nr:S-layer homology domain-containing protein [Clostridia bacterium]